MASHNTKVWFITGSSTGFGRSLARVVLAHGDRVVATARKPQQLDDLVDQYPDTAIAVRLDVTNQQEIHSAVSLTLDTFGRIDVLVNNAGYGAMGTIEEVSDQAIRREYETNVFGALDVMRAVLPVMRKQRSGHILNISSVGGFVSYGGSGIYCSTKFALEGLSEALAKEVGSLGIKVTIVEPGAFRTDFNGRSIVMPERRIDDYTPNVGKSLKWMQDINGKQPGDPDKAAEAMLKVVETDEPPLRLVLGADALSEVRKKLELVKQDIEHWKNVTINTAYLNVATGPDWWVNLDTNTELSTSL